MTRFNSGRRPRPLTLSTFAVAVAVLAPLAAPRPAAAVTPGEVDAAVQKAVAFLYSKQQKEGGRWELDAIRKGHEHHWDTMQGDTWGGYTALCVYALLSAGEKPTDPRMAAALDFLKNADIAGVYSLGMRCQVYARLTSTPETRKILQDDANRLERGVIREGPAAGLWDYESGKPNRGPGRVDHSVSQYGVLGMWAAVEGGAAVRPEVWQKFDSVWRSHQSADGGWSYDGTPKEEKKTTMAMTAAGVATLLITQEMLSTAAAGGTLGCRGNTMDRQVEAGMAYLAANMNEVNSNYTWFGIQRIGAAAGYKYIGTTDWYQVGTEKLVASQQQDGSWVNQAAIGSSSISETAFALLFLTHARSPVVVNKLNYAATPDGTPRDNANWNQRPRDASNLTRFITRTSEAALNWQVTTTAAPVRELHDAPILYICGNKPLALTPVEEARLKEFAEGGGLILCNADCPDFKEGEDPFVKSVKDLGMKLFSRRFRELPPDHPILVDQQFKSTRWKVKPTVWGITNGVRELMILFPQEDVSRAWQLGASRSDPAKFELGANIFMYAVDKQQLGFKGLSHYLPPLPPVTVPGVQPTTQSSNGVGQPATTGPTTQPATVAAAGTPGAATQPASLPAYSRIVRVARLRAGANWDPEPGGWRRLDAIMRPGYGVAISIEPVTPGEGKLVAGRDGYGLAHLTGTVKFQLTPAQRQEIKTYVERGGTLVVDAAGGSGEFADAAEAELAAIFNAKPGNIGVILPPTDRLYMHPQARMTVFGYRSYLRARVAGKLTAPRLRGIEEAGRTQVFFSREDISGGMVGQNVDGILGYEPATATSMMRNIVLYVAK